MTSALRCSVPASADRVVVSVNPRAGWQSNQGPVEQLVERLAQQGIQALVYTQLDEVAAQANALHQAGRLRALVAAGGDGTAAELVNRTLPGLPIAIFPTGTENLIARHLGLGTTPEAVCRMVTGGHAVRLDAGQAGERVFLIMASCGFDAEVVRRVHSQRRGHISRLSYAKPILDAVRNYHFPEIHVAATCDADPGASAEGVLHWSARWVFAFNLPCYGGGLKVAPQTDPGDGRFDVCTLQRGGLWNGLNYVAAVFRGRHGRLADCVQRRVRRLQLTADAPVPYQLDGDPGGYLPLELEVLPQRLTFLVPE